MVSAKDGQAEYQTGYAPAATDERGIADAKRWLFERRDLIGSVPTERLLKWLTGLALQTAGSSMTEADARVKVQAYAFSMGDMPVFLFTPDTLRAAAKHFRWFPAVAEIVKFLEGECGKQIRMLRAVRDVARGVQPIDSGMRPYYGQPVHKPIDMVAMLATYLRYGNHRAARLEAEMIRDGRQSEVDEAKARIAAERAGRAAKQDDVPF